MKRKLPHFNIITWNINNRTLYAYDIIPYFIERWKEDKKRTHKLWCIGNEDDTKMPKTLEEFKIFVKNWGRYQFWSRCEYEIVVTSFPPDDKNAKKIDVYDQICMNLDIIAKLLMDTILPNKK